VRPALKTSAFRAAILGLAALTLLAGAPSWAKDKKPARAPEDTPPFEIVLESEQLDFTAEDAITMNATVYNNTDMDAIVDIGKLGGHGKYDLMSLDNEDVLESGGWEPEKGFPPHKVTLKAHHSLTRFVNLTKELAALLREEGRIRVSLSFCDTAFGGDSAKPRCVDSNAIILRIRKEAGGRQIRPR
jgi:hypothetical protein